MYEYTKNDDQRYKEGKFVLEVECLTSVRALMIKIIYAYLFMPLNAIYPN